MPAIPDRRKSTPSEAAPAGKEVRESPLEVRPPTPDALCIETPLSSLDAPTTPTDHFYVRNHFATPHVEVETWRLRIEGAVDRPYDLTYDQVCALPSREVEAVLECAGNSRSSVRPRPEGVLWRNGAVGTARWRGIPLSDLLERAGIRAGAVEVMLEGADRGQEPGVSRDISFQMSVSLAKAIDPDTLVALEMNGEPLSRRHGFPARVVVPDWYGMASVKWVTRIVVLTEPFKGHFRTRAYAYIAEGDAAESEKRPVTTVRVKSLITWPKEGAVLSPGPLRLRGVAWSGHGRIIRVDVNLGGLGGPREEETWHPAVLIPADSPHSWTHWEYDGHAERPGFYVVRARATDEQGHTQPVQATWNFRGLGNNSIHTVPVEVRRPGAAG